MSLKYSINGQCFPCLTKMLGKNTSIMFKSLLRCRRLQTFDDPSRLNRVVTTFFNMCLLDSMKPFRKQKPAGGKKNVHDSPQFDTSRKTELETPALQQKLRLNMAVKVAPGN